MRSVTHVSALTVFSKNVAPGEKPKLEGVLEQRVTSFLVHILIGTLNSSNFFPMDQMIFTDLNFRSDRWI